MATGFTTHPLKIRLRPSVVLIAVSISSRKQADQDHSDQESTDVCPPGDPTGVGRSCRERCRTVEELHDEPETEDDKGGYFDYLDEDKNRNEGQHASARIRDNVCPEYAGNGTACANAWDRGVEVQDGV